MRPINNFRLLWQMSFIVLWLFTSMQFSLLRLLDPAGLNAFTYARKALFIYLKVVRSSEKAGIRCVYSDQYWREQRITGWEPFTTTPKLDRRTVAWNKLDSVPGMLHFLFPIFSVQPIFLSSFHMPCHMFRVLSRCSPC